MKINVTKKHIKEGVIADAGSCPVALALKAKTQEQWFICGEFAERLNTVNEVRLPVTVAEFIRRFDDRKPVKPFSFSITLPK